MTTWTMPLSYTKPPLSLNDRGHWAKTDQHRKALRAWSCAAARKIGVPTGMGHITTRLHYRPPDRRRRDEDNLIATAKPLWDGLVDAGIVPDDTSEFMTKLMPRIHPPAPEGPALWLTIEGDEP
jgi:crossover junction endodeoxyribonuclease RusA